jgi:hypothetical protein
LFDDKLLHDVVRQMAKDNAVNLNKVITPNQTHHRRSHLVRAVLREVEIFSDRSQVSPIPYKLLSVKLQTFETKRLMVRLLSLLKMLSANQRFLLLILH